MQAVGKIYDDYHKLVDFKTECWYDKDVDQLYDDMVIGTLDEEVYMPKEKPPLISLKGHDYFPKPQASRFKDQLKKRKAVNRVVSMPALRPEKQFKNVEKSQPRLSLIQQNSSLMQKLGITSPTATDQDVSSKQVFDLSPSINIVPIECMSPILRGDSVVEKPQEPMDKGSIFITEKLEAQNRTQKAVGKVKFSSTPRLEHTQVTKLPQVSQLSNQKSLDSFRKFPKIVRKILDKKMHIDPSVIKSIEEDEKPKGM